MRLRAASALLTAAADRACSQAERVLVDLLRAAGITGWQLGYSYQTSALTHDHQNSQNGGRVVGGSLGIAGHDGFHDGDDGTDLSGGGAGERQAVGEERVQAGSVQR